MSLGYILGKASAKTLKTDLNVPLVMTLSIIPDMDIVVEHINGLGQIIPHRGPFHSIIIMTAAFIPLFVVYRKQAIPYFIALVSHPLIGDYLTGGNLQLFWPITSETYGIPMSIYSPQNVGLELILFVSCIALLLASRDLLQLFRPRLPNFVLTVPTFTVLLPVLLSYPLQVPAALVLPHIIFTIVFIASLIITLIHLLKNGAISNSAPESKKEREEGA